MSRFHRNIFSVIILIVICLAAFFVAIKDKVPAHMFSFIDIGTYKMPDSYIEVNASTAVGQSFRSHFDNLFMMSVFIPKQDLNRKGELYFHLKGSKDEKEDIAVIKWDCKDIVFKNRDFYTIPPDREISEKGFHFYFKFPVIKESKDRMFYFYFSSPSEKEGKGIRLGVWPKAKYYEALTEGQFFINNKPANGFLAFRAFNTWPGSVNLLFRDIKERFSTDRPFFIFYSLLLSVVLLGLLTTIRK